MFTPIPKRLCISNTIHAYVYAHKSRYIQIYLQLRNFVQTLVEKNIVDIFIEISQLFSILWKQLIQRISYVTISRQAVNMILCYD